MALYRFSAVEQGGAPREVLIEADTKKDAFSRLKSRGSIPVRFLGEASEEGKKSLSLKRSKIDTYSFTRQLSPLLDSFIPLERALAIIAESAEEGEQKEFVNSMRRGLHEGKKFSELVRSHGKVFPGYYANLVESGEETGCLPQVVRELNNFMTESRELKEFLVSSSIYPLAILGVTLCVTVLLFTVFVPRFAKIFADMGRTMPPSMDFLMAAGNFFSYAWWLVPCLIILFIAASKRMLGEEKFRYKTGQLATSLPLIGKIAVSLEMCKYFRTLSILASNHVEIIKTVKIAGRVIVNPAVAEPFADIARKLKSGAKLSHALAGNPCIPAEAVPMLRVGEESGNVGEMLSRISLHLEADTRTKIKRLLTLFEPAVIIFLAVMVLIVVVSIFMAMMDINSITQGGPGI